MHRRCLAFLVALSAATQPRPKFDAFEVAAIKPSDPDSRGRWIRMAAANQLNAKNHSLITLIAAAYNLSPKAISGGPDWAANDRFDIAARTPGSVRPNLDEQMAMLRNLLDDRFHLTFHRERKELPVYAVTVARGGPKLNKSTFSPGSTPEGPPPLVIVISPDGVSMPARYTTMAEMVSVLQRAAMDRPVIDRTGLAGRYDFTLEWMPDETQFGGIVPANPESKKHDLYAAIQQQLGLKIEATRGPVDTLVIVRAEKPAAN